MRTQRLLLHITFYTLLVLGGLRIGHAQNSEVGIQLGGTHFLGDVGPYTVYPPQGYFGSVFYRYTFRQYYALRVEGSLGQIEANDANSLRGDRYERNLSFRSSIWDAKALVEFNFFRFNPRSKDYNKTFYIFGGFGLMGFDPETEYNGKWIGLRDLGTEGQGTPLSSNNKYNRTAITYPFGFGFKYAFNEHWQINTEFMAISTTTDYLDDVSGDYVNASQLAIFQNQVAADLSDRSPVERDRSGYARGNPNTNDWYFYTGIGLIWRFTSKQEKCDKFWGR